MTYDVDDIYVPPESGFETDYKIPLNGYTLGELILELGRMARNGLRDHVPHTGFHKPHSYRGYYECLAFEPCHGITIGQMFQITTDCVERGFEGYKGGLFIMREYTDVYLAYEGSGGGTQINKMMLDSMIGKEDVWHQ